MKRYSDRDWKSAQNNAATKANTAITATENKIESTGMTTSSCPMPVCREIRHGSLTPINGAVPNGRWATEPPASRHHTSKIGIGVHVRVGSRLCENTPR